MALVYLLTGIFFASTALGGECVKVQSISELPAAAREIQAMGDYTPCKIQLNGTNFFVLSREKGGFGQDRIEKAIELAWPRFHRLFGTVLPDSTVVDAGNAPIGGGPMGDFAVGIYSTEFISPEMGIFIEKVIGWAPHNSTRAYIEKYYRDFDDPIQAYVEDIVTHELGHFLFGFGITKVKSLEYDDFWFALGLGITFDRLIWSEFRQKPSPLFESIVDIWRKKFSSVAEIDQRLVNPDKSKDKLYNLDRLQTFGHGKAWVYLSALRESIGTAEFDSIARKYLERPKGSEITYDDFLKHFAPSHKATIEATEKEYLVR